MRNNLENSNLKILNKFDGVTRNLFLLGSVFLFVSLILFFLDKHHFFFSYLTSFSFFLTLTLGSMFIVLLQYVTTAGWSVLVRRVPELFMNNIYIIALFFIPILFGMHDLYHWTHLEDVMNDHILQVKRPYLNTFFFIVRMIVYFSLWCWISKKFFSNSVSQDDTGDHKVTLNLQRSSTYSMIIFGLTITFSGVDLIMSLTPHWYSTIFGVYIFAGAVTVAYCFTSLMYMYLRKKGFLKEIITIEHFHDLGKLVYGFNIFWSYIAFCQFFLIWYGNVPEETIFYAKHFVGSWSTVSYFLIIGHFAIPFLFFMSRIFKRNLAYHSIMLVWLVFMHFVDLFWIIIPNSSKLGFKFHFVDITIFLGLGCIYFGFFFLKMKKVCLIPKKDPRLSESLNFVNF